MTRPEPLRTAGVALGALSLLGSLAACSTAVSGDGADAADSSGSASTSSGDYKDGEYTATGQYQSPDGQEQITVDLTIADNAVTAVSVTGEPSGPDAEHYQSQFESGISALVVGKSLDEIDVTKVSGSSLTSAGFNAAVDDIKSQAAA